MLYKVDFIIIVNMPRGKIKNILEDKGCGFITAEDGKDFSFHRSDPHDVDLKDVKVGDRVEFIVRRDPRGGGSRAVYMRKV